MEVNQCDGCKRGLAVKDNIHIEKDGKPYIGCSSSLYEKSNHPSDLEIVQKALSKAGLTMHFHSDGSAQIAGRYFDDSDEMLTWAKQTIGEE